MAAPGSISRRAICMDYFSRKPDFPTFEDIYIARAQGAIELERRGDEVACRFGPDDPAFMLPRGATRGDIIRGCLACDGIVGDEKKPEVVVAAKPDPVELGHRASVAASSTAGDRARGAGIRQ